MSAYFGDILVLRPNTVKITDFGLAKMLELGEEEYKGKGGRVC